MATMRFNVFTKAKKTAEGKDFKVYLTKNNNGVTYEVRYVQGCEGLKLLPKSNEPYVLVVDTSNLSLASKRVKSKTEDNKYYTKNIIYVRAIKDVEDYEEPEFDVDAFNNTTNNVDENGESLPF